MDIIKNVEGDKVTLALSGRLDTTTSPEFEAEIKNTITQAQELYLDLEKLDYVSSAGLRVFLIAQKTMNKRGKMVIKNVNEIITEIFEVTGFIDILTIE